MNKATKQKMYCVYSPWGFHRCYSVRSDAEKDARQKNKMDGLMHNSVIPCKVELTPEYN